MKKQFNRMRQLANQTVGRAEKTEVLSEDLLQVEKRLDLVKQVTHSAHKKLTACLQGHQGADVERKSLKSPSKKLPLSILAQCLAEGAAVLGDDALLGKMLKMCGEAEEKLAQELMDFELQVEQDVVEPLSTLAEVDIPNIQKQRKHLAKLVLDMDSSRTRYQQSSKSSSHPGTLQPGAKSDSLREEMEDAATRMEICKDQLSADMYAFAAKEVDYANYFQTLMETQAEYHSKSLEILTAILPQIRAHQEAWLEKPSFGKPLEEHLNISGREIAFPIEACVTALLECGLREEGLFRVAPSASKLKKLKASLDCGVLDAQEYSSDPHAIAGALKSYLRELPEPLMTMELYDEWIQASNIQDMDKRLQALMGTCAKLPTDNLNNFRYLVKFLAKLSEYQDYNKMTPGNMAIVLGPNLLWTHSEPDMTEVLTTLSLQMVGIIEPIIQHADWFFPGKMDFNLTGSYGSPVHVNYNCNYSSLPSPDTEQSERMRPHHDQSRRPLSVATDNMMLEFYKEKDGIRKIQSPAWACGSWILPGCRARARLRWPARAAAPRQGSAPRPPTRSPPPSRPPRQLPHRLSRRPPLRPPWKGSDGSRERVFASVRRVRDLTRLRAWVQAHGTRRSSKSKELSPVIGHKGIQAASSTVLPSGSMQNCSPCPRLGERSPRSLGKGSKKLAPEPPKVPYYQPVALSDQSAGQPSPVSQSPTPPGTPSVYGLLCAPGQALPPCSPGQPLSGAPHSLSSLPSLAGTLAKSRPRQRPGLPPPQPPVGLGGRDPGPVRAPALQPPEPALTDGLSPGESMSTGLSRGILMMISSQSLYFLVRGGRQEMACPHPQCMEPVRLAKRDDTEGKANRIHGSTAATSAITVKVERSTTRHRAVLHTRRRRILGGRTTVNTTLNASSSVMGLPRALMTKISELLHGLVRRSVGRWRRSESAQKKRRSRPRREAAEVVSSSSRASGLPTGTSNVCPPPPPLSASSSGCPLPCAKASCSSCRFLIKVRCLHTGQARVSRICPSA
ncbi:rho GTPase-activating protein 44 isoform X12 [Syngnathus scovelli]|uniref:rho GTPase-activating protein 44 isoform X12 n=1 Tax=Syngnathus scovelli TaxID=161590 RepID=UPI0035CC9717